MTLCTSSLLYTYIQKKSSMVGILFDQHRILSMMLREPVITSLLLSDVLSQMAVCAVYVSTLVAYHFFSLGQAETLYLWPLVVEMVLF